MAKYWFEELVSLDVNIDIASNLDTGKIDLKKILYMYLYLNHMRQQIHMLL